MFKEFQIFAAPLAGITDKPFRKILRKCAPDAALETEMISCHSLVEQHKNCPRNFDRYDDEGLIGAQIFGAEPELMATAAKILEQQGAKWVDINMGCPVPKVATRAGAGAFLMRDHKLAGKIITEVVKAVKIPVSIKTRLGWDDAHLDSAELVRIAANAGVQFATIHGRTRAQGYAGKADWNKIAKIVGTHICAQLPRSGSNIIAPNGAMGRNYAPLQIPVIFNGDIKTEGDIAAVEKLGASGAMIGRALLGNPWLLGKLSGSSKFSAFSSQLILEHFDLVLDYYGERTGVPMFRKHAAWYSNGMQNSAEFRTKVNKIARADDMSEALREFFIL